jgi:hypothetical protein
MTDADVTPEVIDAEIQDICIDYSIRVGMSRARAAYRAEIERLRAQLAANIGMRGRDAAHAGATPIDMVLHCPSCGAQHIDAPELTNDWTNPPHKSHLCHSCGAVWRPADVPTNGVARTQTRGSGDTWG